MKQILLLAALALTFVSCSSSDDAEYDNKTKQWGYVSSYIGYTSHSAATQFKDREEIAKGLVAALNYGNSIYMNAMNSVMPELFETTGQKRIDNSTCNINGTRTYTTRTDTFNDAETNIVFDNYCIENNIAPVINTVTIHSTKDNVTVLSGTKADNVSSIRTTTHNLLPKYLGVNIRRGNMLWDNKTISAGVITRGKTINIGNNDNVTSETYHVGLDMLSGADVWRFDLFVQNSPSFNKSIVFYNNKFGYVEADAAWLTNESVSLGDTITMKFRDNKECTFMPQEIGTKAFDCKKK